MGLLYVRRIVRRALTGVRARFCSRYRLTILPYKRRCVPEYWQEDKVSHRMKRFLTRLLKHEGGQDLIEYSLILAFVALSSAALMLRSGTEVSQVWSSANSVLSQATPSVSHHHGGGDD